MNSDNAAERNTVREQLLDHAQALLMTRGYNGFSYRDLSELVGVKTSSIHYYFPSKDDLVLEAVNTYSADVMSSIYAIDSSATAEKKLDRYVKLIGKLLGDGNRICLCGMLAADIATLNEDIRRAVQAFFKANESWLAKILIEGDKQETLWLNGKPDACARTLFAAFQGSLLSARLFHGKVRLDEVAQTLKR